MMSHSICMHYRLFLILTFSVLSSQVVHAEKSIPFVNKYYGGNGFYHNKEYQGLRQSHHHDKEEKPPPSLLMMLLKESPRLNLQPKTLKHREYKLFHFQVEVPKLQQERQYQERFLRDTTSTITTTTTKNKNNDNENDWKDSFRMFLIWTMDNLIWLPPFVAHSPYHAATFFVTYQLTVLTTAWCSSSYGLLVFGGRKEDTVFLDAHSQNIIYGAISAIACWCVALYYWIRHNQKKTLTPSRTTSDVKNFFIKKQPHQSVNEKEHHLDTPLLKPTPSALPDQNLLQHQTFNIQPTMLLVIVMTKLSSFDDLAFVPVLIETHELSFMELQMGAMFAAAVWSVVALLVTHCYGSTLSRIPLFVVFVVFASSVTGHCLWDYFTTPSMAKQAVVETLVSHFHG